MEAKQFFQRKIISYHHDDHQIYKKFNNLQWSIISACVYIILRFSSKMIFTSIVAANQTNEQQAEEQQFEHQKYEIKREKKNGK